MIAVPHKRKEPFFMWRDFHETRQKKTNLMNHIHAKFVFHKSLIKLTQNSNAIKRESHESRYEKSPKSTKLY